MGPCRLLKTIFAQFLGKYRVVSALFGKIERLTFTGTFDAFQHLVKSHSFKQICFPHRSEMGVLKSFLSTRFSSFEHCFQRCDFVVFGRHGFRNKGDGECPYFTRTSNLHFRRNACGSGLEEALGALLGTLSSVLRPGATEPFARALQAPRPRQKPIFNAL